MGMPRKNKEVMKAIILEESCIGLAAGGLLRRVTQLEPTEKPSRECRIRTRKFDHVGTNEEVPYQHLKKAKLAIAKIYQEKRELK
jgi:hypothetical protein